MNRLIKYILPIVIVISLVIPGLGLAQDQVVISVLEVDIWPEYDRPGVLIIYRITLSPEVSLPVELTLNIPTGAGEPNAVAVKETGGSLFNIAYTREVNGDWSKIAFTATMPEIQVEYYNPTINKQNRNRHFEFSWMGDYAIDELSIQVQQPAGASNMVIKPTLGNGVTNPDGLVYYNSQVGSLAAGQSFMLTLDYEKETDDLSAETLEIEPSTPITTVTAPQRSFASILPWILGILGIFLIFGGTLWYWQSGKVKYGAKTKAPRKKKRRSVSSDQVVSGEEGYIYCQNCGKRALKNDRFCRVCGTKLRVE